MTVRYNSASQLHLPVATDCTIVVRMLKLKWVGLEHALLQRTFWYFGLTRS